MGDVPAATAILDRFLQHATRIEITGPSYRLHGNRDTPEGTDGKPKTRRGAGGKPNDA